MLSPRTIAARVLVGTVAAAATLALTARAHAQTAAPVVEIGAPDVLELTDGTTLQGRVLELRLFQDATIQIEDGSVRTVPWSMLANGSADILNLQAAANWRASAVTVLPLVPVVPVAQPAFSPYDLLQPGPGRVPLHVESDGGPQNVGIGAPGRRREPVALLCTTPCTLYVAPGLFPLYTGGANARPAVHPVMVTSRGARVLAHAGTPTQRALGIALLPLGGVSFVAGVVMALANGSGSGVGSDLGVAFAASGVGMLVGGAIALRRSRPGVSYLGPIAPAGMGFTF